MHIQTAPSKKTLPKSKSDVYESDVFESDVSESDGSESDNSECESKSDFNLVFMNLDIF